MTKNKPTDVILSESKYQAMQYALQARMNLQFTTVELSNILNWLISPYQVGDKELETAQELQNKIYRVYLEACRNEK